jgi:hypothetical protein
MHALTFLAEGCDRVNGVWRLRRPADGGGMWTLLIILLVVWAGLAVFGFVVKGLIWLAVLGIVLFLATLVIGMLRRTAATKD